MEDLASQLLFVLSHFGLKTVIGFGVGSGANVLARFALAHSDKVGAICLINCSSTTSGWMEWGYQSFNARYLRTKGMTQGVVDYLMWHHFGRNPEERNHDLAQVSRGVTSCAHPSHSIISNETKKKKKIPIYRPRRVCTNTRNEFKDVQGAFRTSGESDQSSHADQRVHPSDRFEYCPNAIRNTAGIENAENARYQYNRIAVAAFRRYGHIEWPSRSNKFHMDEGMFAGPHD